MLTESDKLFLDTLTDLEQRVRSPDPYQVLGISALVRKLLLDASPLVDQANQKRRLKVRFRIGLPRELPPGIPEPAFYLMQDRLDPDTARPGTKSTFVSRDGFLAATVANVNGKSLSVRHLVSFEAHVKGGVHAGTPKNEADRILQDLGRLYKVGGYRASLRQLQAIGRVVLKGLQELKQAVEQDA
jgi:hypothetical protein